MENEAEVGYRFFVREGHGGLVVPKPSASVGSVIVDKSTGQVALQVACPDDAGEVLYGRVGAVLRRHWRKGEYPATTWWAA